MFVDLDNTLVRSSPWRVGAEGVRVSDSLVTVPRPGAADFLAGTAALSDLYLFTAADLAYAGAVLDACRLRHHFLGLYSSMVEYRGSVAGTLELPSRCWVLVDDTPSDHPLTRYKLECLGMEDGEEDCRHVGVKPFDPAVPEVNPLSGVLSRVRDRLELPRFF